MIKAVIFDCYGVLVQGSLHQFIDTYFSNDDETIKKAQEINDKCSIGQISYEEQIEEFARMSGLSVADTHREMDKNPPNIQLLSYISSELKGKYKIGMLSNAGENLLDSLIGVENVELFDETVLSYEYHVVKPQPEIYEITLDKLNVNPEEAIFVDDIKSYCEAAESLGIKSIQYVNFNQFRNELDNLLNVADSDE